VERLLVLESSAPHFSFGCKSWAFAARALRLLIAKKRLDKLGGCISGPGF
jgi:hypothetical protein